MNVLSLFDGMSCGQIALERVGIKVDNYYAAEIDKYAIKVTQSNYPSTIQLGDVKDVKGSKLPKIDLLIGGSPCQGFSFAGKQLNFEDPRSRLFFEFVRLIKECKPKYFMLENVKMKKEYQNIISEYLGVKPIEINSSLVSAQNRRRLYWTNIPYINIPEDKNIILNDVLERNIKYTLHKIKKIIPIENHKSNIGLKCIGGLSGIKKWLSDGKNYQRNYSQGERIYSVLGKSPTISAHSGGTAGVGNLLISENLNNGFRRLTPIECERLQTVPDNYTNHVSNTQRYKMLGNGWTVDVIAHIFKGLK